MNARPAGRAPNIRDVAAAAGVSHQTVSRVLNNSPKIRDKTRLAVLAAIEEIGYRPNQAARVLASQRTRMIGVLSTHSTALYGPQAIMIAMEQAANANGYRLALVTAMGIGLGVEDDIERLLAQGVEAIVVIAPQAKLVSTVAAAAPGVPLFVADSLDRPGAFNVAVNQYQGSYQAVQHLIELGHTEILHVGGPQNWIEADERMQGFLAAIGEAELRMHPPILGEHTASFGYQAGKELLRGDPFTAVFALNDQVALGLIHAFREAGVRVPEDVSVVGFDDVPDAGHFFPPLTTVRQDFAAVGRRMVQEVIAQLEGEGARSVILPAPLLVRESSARVPTRQNWPEKNRENSPE
ncbi:MULTISPECIES: LacI family DNA-binding transcriptional regulator [Mycetocola]|uniref:LacI family DNA-binding transcriptional regulator n=1 Tax=Mycetocola TaxID=76634 RepID=UPI00068CEC8C|nr:MULTISPECIES: LacI family DNA-binding transcriptional regulator [Mycetocola]